MLIRNWGPDGIARVCRAAVHRAYRRMVRSGCLGEAERLYRWFGDDYREQCAELIVGNIRSELIKAPARQILRQLSTIIMQRHLKAEIGNRKKRRTR